MARCTSHAERATRSMRGRAANRLGRTAEDIAAGFLLSQGLTLLCRNFRRRCGEIDLVARDNDVLVIVEVRTRSGTGYGGAAASIDTRKQRRIALAASLMLQRYKDLARMRVRFDVVIVSGAPADEPRIQWIQHAFSAI